MLLDSVKPYTILLQSETNEVIGYSTGRADSSWVVPELPPVEAPQGGDIPLEFPTFVDSTMLAAYKSCPRRFFYEHCRHLKAKRKNVHFVAGGAYASGMEIARRAYFENGYPAEVATHLGFLALSTGYGDYDPPDTEAKTWARTCAAYLSYFQRWPLEEDHIRPHVYHGRPMIEYTFSHPIPSTSHPTSGDPILLAGRCDQIVVWPSLSHKLFIYDDKTTKSFSLNWAREWHLRGQFTGYCWAAQENGIPVDGAIVRGTAIQKTQIKHLDAVTYRHDWEIQRWLQTTIGTVDRMCEDWVRFTKYGVDAFLQDFDSACTSYGGCGFAEACDHLDPEPFIEMSFEQRVWNPLAQL